MVTTLGRLLAAFLKIATSTVALEVAGAAAIVAGAAMYSPRVAWVVAGSLLLVKAADLDSRRGS